MNKMEKRFVALVIVFASIMSFLPIQFGSNGQAANAITSQIQVSGTATQTGDNIIITNGEYSTQQQYKDFTLSVDDKIVNQDNIPIGQTGVIAQEVIITSIDGIALDVGADNADNAAKLISNNLKLGDIGCSISAGDLKIIDDNNNKKIGLTITNLPLGINKIEYRIKETTVLNKGDTVIDTPATATTPATTKVINAFQPAVDEYFPSSVSTKEVVIQHGNGYVQAQVPYIDFVDYIGGRPANPDTTLEDNKTPFQYMETVPSKAGESLRFQHDIPNSVTDMDYKISFPYGVNISGGDKVYINGSSATNVGSSSDNKVLTGSLEKTSTPTLLVIAIKHNGALQNTYSIEIQYNNKLAQNDYVLKDAGIAKYNYNSDSTIKAFIGKEFTTTIDANGVFIYTGTITIDKLADMINMKPTLGRDSASTVFKISNHYDNDILPPQTGGDGKQYVNFHQGANNVIWLEVWEGKDGNATGNSALAIYKLNVNLTDNTSDSTVDFTLPGNSTDNPVYLTQPGRTGIAEAIPFSADRRTYDLHSELDDVVFNLIKPSTHNEYIRAWGGTSIQGDSVTEIDNLGKSSTVTINTKDYKKVILQAYYDEIVYKNDPITGDPIIENDKRVIESQTPYPIGQKYIFYIAKNAGTPDPTTGTTSSDASLSNVKAGNGTVKSTDNINYMVKVPKADTLSGITVTATNSKVKDISATISETGDEYGLTSGESFNFPLNTTGTTNIKVVVTAEDGITSKTYNITVTNDTRSASALLKNVVTDNGDFTFDPEASINKIRVDQVIKKLKVAPIPTDSKSNVTVNGTKFSGSPITIDLAGSQQTNMEIVVVSEDGSDSKTYSFEIYRTDATLNPDDNTNQDDVFHDDIDDCWVDTSKYEEWGKVEGKDIYFNNKGRQVKEQWINTKNTWYYLDSNGYKTSGWRKDIGGKSYYLDPTTGELKTGWMNINNKMYYMGLNGVMQKGWLYLNSKWYYFTPEGEMVTNQSMFINDKVYNFRQDGVMY